MSPRRVASVVLLGVLVPITGCASVRRGDRTEAAEGVSMEKGAIILAGPALKDGPGTVLAAMSGKVPNFRVRRHTGQCPEITLRNQVSFQAVSNPHVYVDGTRTADTCILESLRTEDVERVEVYPQGFTTRPGYGTHAHGLILVFMRSS
jgi:hypothetical protein